MIIYILYSNIIWSCIASAAVGAGAVLLALYISDRGKKDIDDLKESQKKDILTGLRDNAEVFGELYESLYLLALGKTGKKDIVADDWLTAVSSLDGNVAFKTAFKAKFGNVASLKGKNKKYVKKAKRLLKLLRRAGIFRNTDLYVTGDEFTAEKYDIVGFGSVEAGVVYDVLSAYWYRLVPDRDTEAVFAEDTEYTEETDADEIAPAAPTGRVKGRKAKKAAKKAKKAAKKAAKQARKEKKAAAPVNTTEKVLARGVIR